MNIRLLASCLTVFGVTATALAQTGVRVIPGDSTVRVEINGELFTEYHFKDVSKPFCYPIIGPGGQAMTRNWPMKETPDEERDHRHHQGLWYAHLQVNSNDVWTVGANAGKIVQESVETRSEEKVGTITAKNKWIAKDGTTLMRDERTLRFHSNRSGRFIDFEINLKATEGDVTLGDDKDAGLSIRVAETMRVLKPAVRGQKASPGDGHIVLSTGVRDNGETAAAAKDARREAVTWGKSAEWCDYYGPVDGKTVGVAIFDHPGNPRHPTWWHVRDYGLFTANAFGQHYFENLPDKTKGDLKIPRGQSVTFRFRFYFHEGDNEQAKVADRYKEYAAEVKK